MKTTSKAAICFGLAAGLFLSGIADTTAQAGFRVRSPSNVCFWYSLSWNELRPAERRAWTSLGWNAELWQHGQDPAVVQRSWTQLSGGQRSVLASLGYTQASWDHVKCAVTER